MLCCAARLLLQAPHLNVQPGTIATTMGVPITVGRCFGLFYSVVFVRFFKIVTTFIRARRRLFDPNHQNRPVCF